MDLLWFHYQNLELILSPPAALPSELLSPSSCSCFGLELNRDRSVSSPSRTFPEACSGPALRCRMAALSCLTLMVAALLLPLRTDGKNFISFTYSITNSEHFYWGKLSPPPLEISLMWMMVNTERLKTFGKHFRMGHWAGGRQLFWTKQQKT